MQLHGHAIARQRLAEAPPGSLLLEGPSGIGKHLLATIAAYHHAAVVDVLTFRPTRMDDVRQLTDWLRTGAVGGKGKAAALDLDGSVPAVAQALLKTLEEPPPNTWLLLSCSGSVPATVASRVTTVHCHPLTGWEVTQVLTALGIFGDDVSRLERLAGGRPGFALQYREAVANRAKVLQLIQAVARRDWSLVARVLGTKWDTSHAVALQLWLADVLNGTTHAYAPGEKAGLDTTVPRPQLVAAAEALAMDVPPSLGVSLATRKILG